MNFTRGERSRPDRAIESGNIFKLFFVFVLYLAFPSISHQRKLLKAYDPCYDRDGNPTFCRPPFQNIALKKEVVVSETCGVPEAERLCRLFEGKGGIQQTCEACESSGPRSHPPRYLTDINDMGNITYWQSKSFQSRGHRDQVTITISFGKSFELSYISLQFYSPRPASMAIYKSSNGGRTWVPYQFYAQNCQARFNRESQSISNQSNEGTAFCSERHSSPLPLTGGRVVFNPTLGRPSASNVENSHILQDWVTATDVKVVLNGVNDINRILPLLGYQRRRSVGNRNSSRTGRRASSHVSRSRTTRFRGGRGPLENGARRSRSRASMLRLRKGPRRSVPGNTGYRHAPARVQRFGFVATAFYAINDITIGGRCKCNGHASSCSIKNGRLACDCKHNTEGVNCERCKPFHFDRPWKRATKTSANECVACNCNLHAKRCRFNADLYEKSGGKSGGVCQKCRHHTTGRFCHFCKPGFYRNPKISSIAHRRVCKTCGCHPVGAAGKICDSSTGQCPCKDGVTGKKCNRCSKGYEQTRSRVAPCIKIRSANTPPPTPCTACKRSKVVQLSVSKWCRFDYVVETEVMEMVKMGKWMRITLKISRVYRRGDGNLGRGLVDVRTREHLIRCHCLRLRKRRKYLLFAKRNSSSSDILVLDKNTIALRWRNLYKKRLFGLVRRSRASGAC